MSLTVLPGKASTVPIRHATPLLASINRGSQVHASRHNVDNNGRTGVPLPL